MRTLKNFGTTEGVFFREIFDNFLRILKGHVFLQWNILKQKLLQGKTFKTDSLYKTLKTTSVHKRELGLDF